MATDTIPPPGATPLVTYRPAMPDDGLGRRVRQLAGIREDILDWVPEERPRYTRLGAIVLNTGIMAAASALIALTNVTGVLWVLLLPAALIWGYLIVCVDGWIVAGTQGVSSGKWRVYLPRLLLSILIGTFVAEPLVLWFFRPAIQNEIPRMRATDVAAYRSKWVHCNPASGGRPKGCAQFIVNVPDSPLSIAQELSRAQAASTGMRATISGIQAAVNARNNLARDECNGVPGQGFSGVVGQGPNCVRDRAVADQYLRDSGLAADVAQEHAYQAQVKTLGQKLAASQQGYASAITTQIGKQVAAWQLGLGRPGLLDQDRALQMLAAQSGFVRFQEWVLRLLLIALDSLPVITKWLSGTTFYDRLFTSQLEIGTRLHDKETGLHERQGTASADVRLRQAEQAYQSDLERIATADRADRADRTVERREEIDRLAARLRADWDRAAEAT